MERFESIREFAVEEVELTKIKGGRDLTEYRSHPDTNVTSEPSPRYDTKTDDVPDFKSGDNEQ